MWDHMQVVSPCSVTGPWVVSWDLEGRAGEGRAHPHSLAFAPYEGNLQPLIWEIILE